MSMKNSMLNTMTNVDTPATDNAPKFDVDSYGNELFMLRAKAEYFETLANELQNEVYALDDSNCRLFTALRQHES